MKRILFAFAAALLMITACDPEENNNNEVSLEGRWNCAPDESPNDYRFSFIFKGNNLDVYIIAWGEHFSGTYTYSDNVITYTIKEAKKAWSGVTFDEQGNMTSYSWMAGDMDQETFALAAGKIRHGAAALEEYQACEEDSSEFFHDTIGLKIISMP